MNCSWKSIEDEKLALSILHEKGNPKWTVSYEIKTSFSMRGVINHSMNLYAFLILVGFSQATLVVVNIEAIQFWSALNRLHSTFVENFSTYTRPFVQEPGRSTHHTRSINPETCRPRQAGGRRVHREPGHFAASEALGTPRWLVECSWWVQWGHHQKEADDAGFLKYFEN